jgi:ATP/maltotriose-dependent transcriptional regulator MalT
MGPSASSIRRSAAALDDVGRSAEAMALLLTGARDLAPSDPSGSVRLMVEAASIALLVSGPQRALEVARDAVGSADDVDPSVAMLAWTRLGDAWMWVGRPNDAHAAWARATAIPAGDDVTILCERANVLLRSGDLTRASEVASEAIVRARQQEDLPLLHDAFGIACTAQIHRGRLREALDLAEQAQDAVREPASAMTLDVLGMIAWVTALLGDVERCRAILDAVASSPVAQRRTAPGGFAAGYLALSLGRFEEAAAAFESKRTELRQGEIAQVLGLRPFLPALVEAYAGSGRPKLAASLLERFAGPAIASGLPTVVAPVLRARGVVDRDPAPLREALRWHEQWGNRFEEGRTWLALGMVARRERRLGEAREALRHAMTCFDEVGARTWRAQAARESRAAGDRSTTTPTPDVGVEHLTAQETAIARLVAQGLSNRDVAERCAVSPKTVERHLTTIFGKLGVGSRSQLVATWSRLDPGDEGFPG